MVHGCEKLKLNIICCYHSFSVADLLLLFQENYYWLDRILRSYQSRIYAGDVGSTFEVGGCDCAYQSML